MSGVNSLLRGPLGGIRSCRELEIDPHIPEYGKVKLVDSINVFGACDDVTPTTSAPALLRKKV